MIRQEKGMARLGKVAAEIRRCLAGPVNELGRANALGIASITKVIVSPDLRNATVFVSFYSESNDAINFFEIANSKSYIFQRIIGDNTRLRRTPSLTFRLDEVCANDDSIERLLRV